MPATPYPGPSSAAAAQQAVPYPGGPIGGHKSSSSSAAADDDDESASSSSASSRGADWLPDGPLAKRSKLGAQLLSGMHGLSGCEGDYEQPQNAQYV